MPRMICLSMLSLLAAIAFCAPPAQALPPLAAPPSPVHRVTRWHGIEAQLMEIPAGADVYPVATRPGRTVAEWARDESAVAVINGGYFNHEDGWSVSHVRRDGHPITDPGRNKALVRNPVLKPVLARIMDHRAEWRSVYLRRGSRWAVTFHDDPLAEGETFHHLLQAGPMLLPTRDLVAEGFIIHDASGRPIRDGIASNARVPRSALGLKPDGSMIWAAVGRPGVNIAQLAALMSSLGAQSAMALDGGSSTSLGWRDTSGTLHTYVGNGGPPPRVASALVVVP